MTNSTTIMLHSGAAMDFLDPSSSEFTLEDIAHGLSNLCRYTGQCKKFYSVAEHSILVSETVVNFGLEALLHDAAEAFVGDLTRPLKQLLPEFKVIENRIQNVILKRFGISELMPQQVKEADIRVLAAEQAQLMPAGLSNWTIETGVVPALVQVRYLSPKSAKEKYLKRFAELGRIKGLSA
mgnify:CR=1 FL=1